MSKAGPDSTCSIIIEIVIEYGRSYHMVLVQFRIPKAVVDDS